MQCETKNTQNTQRNIFEICVYQCFVSSYTDQTRYCVFFVRVRNYQALQPLKTLWNSTLRLASAALSVSPDSCFNLFNEQHVKSVQPSAVEKRV